MEGIFFPVEVGCEVEPSHMVSYRLCADGVYLQKKVGCGHVTVKVDTIGNIPKGVESIKTLPRQFPIDVYNKTVDFFRAVESKFGAKGTEAYVIVAYNTANDSFFLWVPQQQVGAASVKYDISNFHTMFPNCVILMDIHSHTSSMGAFWSGTDDADDNRDRYSMVIGKINQIFPEYKIRFSTMKKRFDKAFDDVFILSDEACAITSDALEQVTQYHAPAAAMYGGQRDMYDPGEYYRSWGGFSAGKQKPAKAKKYDVDSWCRGENKNLDTDSISFDINERNNFNLSTYDMMKHRAAKGRDFSISELMGSDW